MRDYRSGPVGCRSPSAIVAGRLSASVSVRTEGPTYEEFYGFVQSPFTLAPDPRFLYRSESHEEAIKVLLQSIRRKEGFIVLTGDIGTGKTTICRALLEQLDTTTFTSLVLNPFVSVEELLREVLLDFGVVSREAGRSARFLTASKHELITTLHEFLLSLVPIKGSGVLIIDEAQHLSKDVLEQIRIVSNLETNQSKLLQIVLVGQLNLLDVLAEADMRQLDQRISLRAFLKPLTRDEAKAYINHRLSVGRGTVTFEDAAIDAVHAYSSGVPRVMNLLCDRALMLGAQRTTRAITSDTVDDAAQALALRRPVVVEKRPWWKRPFAWWMSALGVMLVAAVLIALLAPLDRLIDAPPPGHPPSPRLRLAEPFLTPTELPAEPVRVKPAARPASVTTPVAEPPAVEPPL